VPDDSSIPVTKLPDALEKALERMVEIYLADPVSAVRSQSFIKVLHGYIRDSLEARLTDQAKKAGIEVKLEGQVLGSHKPKDVDVCVVDPVNGPLMLIGVRSQMSAVGKNALNYYEGIIGECISLQDRFPMSSHGYVYLMPKTVIKEGSEAEVINHPRYARMYEAITGRGGNEYSKSRGIFDQFAYMVVDFTASPPRLEDQLIQGPSEFDLSIITFVDRMIETFNSRMLFREIFTPEPPAQTAMALEAS